MKRPTFLCPIGDGKKIPPHPCKVQRVENGRLMASCGTHGFRAFVPDVKPFDPVNRPAHYADRKIEVIDFIVDSGWGEGFCLGNATKYIARAGKKDPAKKVEDLEKAAWYLNYWIAALKKREADRG